jgi:hypothetical protein
MVPDRPLGVARPELAAPSARSAQTSRRALVPSPALSERRGLDLVDRAELQHAVDLWDYALSLAARTSTPTPGPVETTYYPAGEPRRAPSAEGEPVTPVRVDHTDGYRPVSDGDLVDHLSELARTGFHTALPVALDFERAEASPVVRVYTFDRPVTNAEGAVGTLYALAPSEDGGELVPFSGETPSLQVVERVDPEGLPSTPVAETLTCTYYAGQARWTRNDP